ncbi:uclacyanin 1-like [Amaranthus tricolor]|uniref:uclacyanin 1-like n=1 Tax=Amaranthus tricolor TaxID=29722 RepID=UPI0025832510|nr:uclacyanin 1-like [Amaranthus tricolor]
MLGTSCCYRVCAWGRKRRGLAAGGDHGGKEELLGCLRAEPKSSHSCPSEQSNFDACGTTNTIGQVQTTSPASITLTTAGTHYFICTVPGHCAANQKLSVAVTGPSATTPASAPAPARIASSPATTPSPAGGAPSTAPAATSTTTPTPATASSPTALTPAAAPAVNPTTAPTYPTSPSTPTDVPTSPSSNLTTPASSSPAADAPAENFATCSSITSLLSLVSVAIATLII